MQYGLMMRSDDDFTAKKMYKYMRILKEQNPGKPITTTKKNIK